MSTQENDVFQGERVDPAAYDWTEALSKNLGREHVSQGDRLTVFHELGASALQGQATACYHAFVDHAPDG